MSRKQMVVGNWKMNKAYVEGLVLTNTVIADLDKYLQQLAVVFCPPFIHLQTVSSMAKDHPVAFSGAQNCHHETKGAFTGEVSAEMIKSIGASYVILGHSERRQYFEESPELIHQKIKQALANDLMPIFCCGEPLAAREAKKHQNYVYQQLEASLFTLSEEEMSKIVVAYEPIWAIGTGQTATPAQAQGMHAFIRQCLSQQYNAQLAAKISILYGGSCKPHNAAELFAQFDIDGALVGGASLVAEDFIKIIQAKIAKIAAST